MDRNELLKLFATLPKPEVVPTSKRKETDIKLDLEEKVSLDTESDAEIHERKFFKERIKFKMMAAIKRDIVRIKGKELSNKLFRIENADAEALRDLEEELASELQPLVEETFHERIPKLALMKVLDTISKEILDQENFDTYLIYRNIMVKMVKKMENPVRAVKDKYTRELSRLVEENNTLRVRAHLLEEEVSEKNKEIAALRTEMAMLQMKFVEQRNTADAFSKIKGEKSLFELESPVEGPASSETSSVPSLRRGGAIRRRGTSTSQTIRPSTPAPTSMSMRAASEVMSPPPKLPAKLMLPSHTTSSSISSGASSLIPPSSLPAPKSPNLLKDTSVNINQHFSRRAVRQRVQNNLRILTSDFKNLKQEVAKKVEEACKLEKEKYKETSAKNSPVLQITPGSRESTIDLEQARISGTVSDAITPIFDKFSEAIKKASVRARSETSTNRVVSVNVLDEWKDILETKIPELKEW